MFLQSWHKKPSKCSAISPGALKAAFFFYQKKLHTNNRFIKTVVLIQQNTKIFYSYPTISMINLNDPTTVQK